MRYLIQKSVTLVILTGIPSSAWGQQYYVEDRGFFHYASAGLRVGGFVFSDSDADDIYGPLPVFGIDLIKFHFFDLPLAAQTSFDFAGGDGDPDVSGPGVIASDSDIFLFNWRLSLLVEPPPGAWGNRDGSFYVTPYAGGGIGVHYVEETVDVDTVSGSASDTNSDANVGFHIMAGIDFVFAWHFSAGVEFLYTTAEIDGADGDIDLGGFAVTANFKVNF
jgi:hypothetical protein